MKIFAAITRLPKAAQGGIGAAVVGLAVIATAMFSGGSDGSATLKVFSGTVQVQADVDDAFRAARNGEVLQPVSTVRTGLDGRAQLTFFDGSITRLNYDTTFSLRELSGTAGGERKILSDQTSGRTFNRVKKLTGSGSRVEVKTPNATASVRGTDHEVQVHENGDATFKVFPDTEAGTSKVVVTSNSGLQQTIQEGEKVTTTADGRMGEVQQLTQEDQDEWKQFNDCLDGLGGCEGQPSEDSALLTQATATPVETARVAPRVFAAAPTDAPVVTEPPLEPVITPEPEPTPEPLLPEPTVQPQAETPDPTEEPAETTPPPPPTQQTGELSGQVVDENSGEGVQGATVTATNTNDPEDTHQTTTDENGTYTFSDLTPGEEYTVSVSADNYQAEDPQTAVVPSEPGQQGQSFVITPQPGSISGTVLDGSGNPVADVQITLDAAPGTIDGTGAYSFADVSAGPEHVLLVSAPGYHDVQRSVTLSPGEDATEDFVLGQRDGHVFGTVVDAESLAPLSGALVELEDAGGTVATDTTDENGAFDLGDVPPGDYDIRFSKDEFDANNQAVTVTHGGSHDLQLELELSDDVRGFVTDEQTDLPLAGAVVSVEGTSIQTTPTGEDGSYKIKGLAAGSTYTLTASHPDYGSQSLPHSVQPNETAEGVNFALTKKPGTVNVTVTDGSGNALADAEVTLTGQSSKSTDAFGLATFTDVPAGGPYTVGASHADYTDEPSEDVNVGAGETVAVSLSVGGQRPGGITVNVTGFGGGPLEAQVALDGGAAATATGGTITFTDVAAGEHSVSVSHDDYDSATRTVHVDPNQTTTETVALTPKPGSVSVSVTGFGGSAIDAQVSLDGGDPVATGSDGEHTFPNVEPGSHSITAQHADYETEPAKTVSVEPNRAATTSFELDAKAGSIVVTVTGVDGPLAGADVSVDGSDTQATDGSGAATFSGVSAGSHVVSVEHADYQSEPDQTVNVGPNGSTPVSVELEPKPGTITVNVTGFGGSRIDASVALDGGAAQSTGDDGSIVFNDVAAGPHSVTASHADYETADAQSFTLAPNGSSTRNFALEAKPGSITVAVTGFLGADLDAQVSLDGAAPVSTGPDGQHTFASVPAGGHTVSVSHSDYETPDARTVNLGPNGSATESFALVAKPGTIHGFVRDAGTGEPIDGASVTLDDGAPVTAAGGEFTFSGVAAGDHVVRAASSPAYFANNVTVSVAPNGAHDTTVQLNPAPGSITGIVKDSVSNGPISGATVSLVGTAFSATTNADGAYSINDVQRGAYTLRAAATNYVTKDVANVSVSAGVQTTQNVNLVKQTGTVSGAVRNASNGQALAGAIVTLNGQEATTPADGTYSFASVPVGTYSMTARKTGFSTATQSSVVVQANQTATVNFSLSEVLGENELRIVLQWGTSPQDLDSHLWLPSSHRYQVYYNRQGRSTACPYATLDVDDTNGEGPETITISRAFAGDDQFYRYGVFRYNSGDIQGSNARVTVYDEDGQLAQFTVPTGTGGWWHPFDASFNTETSEWQLNPVAPASAISASSPEPYADNASCN